MHDRKAAGMNSGSILVTLIERMASLTPEEYITPTASVADSSIIIGQLDDDLRRMWTVLERTRLEYNAQAESADELTKSLLGSSGTVDALTTLRHLAVHGVSIADVDKLEDTLAAADRLGELYGVLKPLFWLEVRKRHAPAEGAQLTIYDDWSVGTEPVAGVGDLLVRMFRSRTDAGERAAAA